MSTQVQFRRGTYTDNISFVGAQGEIIAELTNYRIVLHDGSTPGGYPAATLYELQNTGNLITALITSSTATLTTNIQATGSALSNKINTVSGNLQTTGQNLYNLLTNLSGANNNSFSTIANLQTTGQTLYNSIIGMSGVFGNSGQALDAKINSLSGYVTGLPFGSGGSGTVNNYNISGGGVTGISVTGGIGITGLVTFSGSGLNIIQSGNKVIFSADLVSGGIMAYTNAQLSALSTTVGSNNATQTLNLANTGSTLDNKINSLSGYVNGLPLGGSGGSTTLLGSGSPEGVRAAVSGTLYIDWASGLLYAKATGVGVNGWI